MVLVGIVDNLESKIQHPPANIDTIEFAQLRAQTQQMSNNIQKYINQYGAVINAYGDNYFSVDILRVIGNISQHKVWFTRLNLNNKTRKCEVEGQSYNTRLVSEFMLEIKRAPFFDNVALISMEKGQDDRVNFKLVCTLK
jgi:Tfp pilus assembly protein PilN